ncbi:hypothetical protein O181_084876 [Austropuccinia psidii MF-1]|uniref:Uncharacterized protein n=1 Tax=Austropuccinia psidii MF-1 TaxID=1389203 RepID=A0A9Q3FRU0_9BASI|nr:hypothetical protein [Austropuccinia psidii MF-1]
MVHYAKDPFSFINYRLLSGCLALEKKSEKAITLHNAAAEKDSFSFSPSEESDWKKLVADEVPLIPVKQQTESLNKVIENLDNLINTNGNPPIAQDLREIHKLLKATIAGLVQVRENFYPMEEYFNAEHKDPIQALEEIRQLYKKLIPKESSRMPESSLKTFEAYYEALEALERNEIETSLLLLQGALRFLKKAAAPHTEDEKSVRLLLEQGVFEAIEYLYTYHLMDIRDLDLLFSDKEVFKILEKHLYISFNVKHSYSPEPRSHFSVKGGEQRKYLQNFVTVLYPDSKKTLYSTTDVKNPSYLFTEDRIQKKSKS